MTKTFFPDTNIFLQCHDLKELTWGEVADGEIILLVARPVQRELDKLKQQGNARRAKRARRAGTLLRQVLEEPDNTLLISDRGNRVWLSLPPPEHAPVPSELDPTSPDDQLIGALLKYSEDAGDPPCLLTGDTSLALTAKQYGIACKLTPEGWLLPPEPDRRDKEINRLKTEVRQLRDDRPSISFMGARGLNLDDGVSLSVVVCSALCEKEIQSLVRRIRTEFPGRSANPPRPAKPPGKRVHFVPPTAMDLHQYDSVDYPNWIQNVESYLRSLHERLEQPSRCDSLGIVVQNEGGSPAHNVVLEVSTTGGIQLLPEDWVPFKVRADPSDALPMPPSPPVGHWKEAPTATGSVEAAMQRLYQSAASQRSIIPDLSLMAPGKEPSRDRHGFYWKPDRPVSPVSMWEIECAEFRHKLEPEEFCVAWMATPEADQQTSHSLLVRVTATNLPTPATVRIPIVVACTQGDTRTLASELVDGLLRRIREMEGE